jgi:hypothetical protein
MVPVARIVLPSFSVAVKEERVVLLTDDSYEGDLPLRGEIQVDVHSGDGTFKKSSAPLVEFIDSCEGCGYLPADLVDDGKYMAQQCSWADRGGCFTHFHVMGDRVSASRIAHASSDDAILGDVSL